MSPRAPSQRAIDHQMKPVVREGLRTPSSRSIISVMPSRRRKAKNIAFVGLAASAHYIAGGGAQEASPLAVAQARAAHQLSQ